MDMIGIIGWILFLIAAGVAAFLAVQRSEPAKRLAEAEAKLRDAQNALETARKQPVPAVVGGAPPPAPSAAQDAEHSATVSRLEAAVVAAQTELQDVQNRANTAAAQAAAAEARAIAAEGMVAQARSKATETGHLAVLEARKEADAVRAQLSSTEARLEAVAAAESKIAELIASAEQMGAEAATSTERAAALFAETQVLQKKLAHAEAHAQEAAQAVEKTLREQFDARLRAAKDAAEAELQNRLAAERDRLTAEWEQTRPALQAVPVPDEVPVRPRPKPAATKSAEIGTPASEKPLVILADTDASASRTLSAHLEAGGYSVRAVQTVRDALAAARTDAPAALAIDGSNLPDGDCWQVLSTVKEDAELKEIPVLVFAPGKDRERAMEMGAAGCFAKPVDKAVLVATIKAAMVKRKQRARLAAASGGTRRSSLLTSPSS